MISTIHCEVLKGICRLLIACASIIFSLQSVSSQNYTVVNYNTENGLPQNSVKSLAFDKQGYCWISTEMGLVRFNGKNFRTWNAENFKGISSNRFRNITSDTAGNLQVWTSAGMDHLAIIIDDENFSSTVKPVNGTNYNFNTSDGFDVSYDLISRCDSAVFLDSILRKPWNLKQLSNMGNEIYFVYGDRVFYIARNKLSVLTKPAEYVTSTHVNHLYIQFFKDSKIAVWENGLLKKQLTQIKGDIVEKQQFLRGDFQVFWCKNGSFILCNQTLYSLEQRGDTLYTTTVFDDLKIPEISTVFYSPENKLYLIGSNTKGLFIVKQSPFVYPALPDGITDGKFYTQAKINGNDIYARGMVFSQKSDTRLLDFSTGNGACFYVTPDDVIYYENNFIVYRYDFKTKKKQQLFTIGTRLTTLQLSPYDSCLYFTTEEGMGMIKGDSLSGFKSITRKQSKDLITGFEFLGKDQFLIASQGLKWYKYSSNTIQKSILEKSQIRTAYIDPEKRIWIGTYGSGFYLYENEKLTKLPVDKKNSLNTVHCFITDNTGNFWLPTNDGLFKVPVSDLLNFAHGKMTDVFYYMFNNSLGLKTNEFNGGCKPAFIRLNDGMISVPSLDGLVWFYPYKIPVLYPDKKIYIDHISVNNLPVTKTGNLVLNPDFEDLSITVSTPYFGLAENLNIEYSIQGINTVWRAVPHDGTISVNNVKGGDYKIMFRKLTGHNNYSYLNFTFTVKSHFYDTWWFRLLLVLLAAALLILLIRRRLRRLHNKSVVLEKEVMARTQQLNITIDQLEESREALKESNEVKDTMISLVLHDLRSPIRFLKSISSYLYTSYHKMKESSRIETLDELSKGTASLSNFVDQFFVWISSQHKNFKVDKTHFPVNELLENVKSLYEEMVKADGNQLIVVPSGLICYTDKNILHTIVRNLVDNANKNTNSGEIKLTCNGDADSMAITITDTGSGMQPEMVDAIMEESLEVSNLQHLGFSMIMGMIKMIDCSITIHSVPGEGTAVILRLKNAKPGGIEAKN